MGRSLHLIGISRAHGPSNDRVPPRSLRVLLLPAVLLLLVLTMLTAGCSFLDGPQQPQVTPAAQAPVAVVPASGGGSAGASSGAAQAVAAPTTALAAPTVRAAGAVIGQTETLVTERAYITRPFGFEEYRYNAGLNVRIIEDRLETDDAGNKYITGKIKNDGPSTARRLSVTFLLCDAEGCVLQNAIATLDSLPSGRTWRFSTEPFNLKNYRYYEVAGVFAA